MRYFFLPILLGLLFLVSYEGIFNYVSDKIAKNKINQTQRVADRIKVFLFNKKLLTWVFKGSQALFPSKNLININNFEAQRVGEYLLVKSRQAVIDKKRKFISLQGNVLVEFKKNGKSIRIKTSKAFVDLTKNIIYGNRDVEVWEPHRVIKGIGFRYNIKTGSFIILRDVKTSINTP